MNAAPTGCRDIGISGYMVSGVSTPRTLDELRRLPPGPDRIYAVGEYIANGEAKIKQARKLRDDDVRELVAEHGPARAAKLSGLTLATVKAIRGRP